MSLPHEEARALRDAWDFLLGLSSGRIKVSGHIAELRAEARRIAKHYPLAADTQWLEAACSPQPACTDCGRLLEDTGPRCRQCAGPMPPRQ